MPSYMSTKNLRRLVRNLRTKSNEKLPIQQTLSSIRNKSESANSQVRSELERNRRDKSHG
ncbi:hypothetical protein MASSI9I_60377 [Massilia sp. 9I]|nr:hypothetical protein MASSI9I_60377 [Massilia sp. 9I]